jgi:hypothetical protein
MNERIEKLWDEAADSIAAIPNGRNNFWETQENFMEKFAELIVRECLTFVEPMPGSGDIDDLALEAAREGIKEHFGVE